MSLSTKHALADSFKKLLSKRSFDKITVKDIVEDCGVNRQTFYYHFHDIYDLIEWIFQDAEDNLNQDSIDWTTGLRTLIQFLHDNRVLILNAYNSISHEVVANYIKEGLHPYCAAIVRHQADAMDTPVLQEDIDFITDILTITASGFVTQWIGNQMKLEDKTLQSMNKLRTVMNGSIELMLKNLSENRP